jgi:hypothetical protein
MIAITCLMAAGARTEEDGLAGEGSRRCSAQDGGGVWGFSIAELWRTACAECGGEVVRLAMTCEVPNPGKTDFEGVRQ